MKMTAAIRTWTREEEIRKTITRGTRTIRARVREMGMFTVLIHAPTARTHSLWGAPLGIVKARDRRGASARGQGAVSEDGDERPRIEDEAGRQVLLPAGL